MKAISALMQNICELTLACNLSLLAWRKISLGVLRYQWVWVTHIFFKTQGQPAVPSARFTGDLALQRSCQGSERREDPFSRVATDTWVICFQNRRLCHL